MFFEILVPALIGSMLAPAFSQFLNTNKRKCDARLQNLEETYLLARKIDEYSTHMPTHMVMVIAQTTKAVSSIPKIPEQPFSRTMILLEYYLNAPDELITKVKLLQDEILLAFRPIGEAINNPQGRDEFYSQAVVKITNAAKKGPLLSNEIIAWIKNEKNQIENAPRIFDKTYWTILWRKVDVFIKQIKSASSKN